MEFKEKLLEVQMKLRAPKNRPNDFGGYKYRNAEDILTAVKPLLGENKLLMNISDTIEMIGERYYVKATVTVTDVETGEKESSVAYAREAQDRKGSDQSQLTGACSSYARKYALSAMFLIGSEDDADSFEPEKPSFMDVPDSKTGTVDFPETGSEDTAPRRRRRNRGE